MRKEEIQKKIESLKEELYAIELKEHNEKSFNEKYILKVEADYDYYFELDFERVYFNLFLNYNNTICNNKDLFLRLETVKTEEELKELLKNKTVYIADIHTHSESTMENLEKVENVTLDFIQKNLKSLVIIENDYYWPYAEHLRKLFNAYFVGYVIAVSIIDDFTKDIKEEFYLYEWDTEENIKKLATQNFGEDCSKLEYQDNYYNN